jgi:hypothetical protein
MFIVLVVTVPVALFLIWAVGTDLKKRRQRQQVTGHNPGQVARDTRNEAQGKGSAWGAGF